MSTTGFITKKDEGEFAKFANPIFAKFCAPLPTTLYHYTRGRSLIPTIENQELWATHISCMNDAKEILHAADEVRKRVIERRATNSDSKIAKLLVKLDEGLAKPQIETMSLFVSCFSEKPDDLSQWRAYGRESLREWS